jgi:hypothetical protein
LVLAFFSMAAPRKLGIKKYSGQFETVVDCDDCRGIDLGQAAYLEGARYWRQKDEKWAHPYSY